MSYFSNSNFPCLAFEFLVRKKVRISLQLTWEKPRWTMNGSNSRSVRIDGGRITEGGTVLLLLLLIIIVFSDVEVNSIYIILALNPLVPY